MKLVGYQQPTCLCVMMEFVVGTISLSCELCSPSEAAFVHEAGTIVYGKLCFDFHVQCCVAWIAQNFRHSSTCV